VQAAIDRAESLDHADVVDAEVIEEPVVIHTVHVGVDER